MMNDEGGHGKHCRHYGAREGGFLLPTGVAWGGHFQPGHQLGLSSRDLYLKNEGFIVND